MSTFITGSICLTDLVDQAKKGHSAFTRGKNGKVYCNIQQWLNDEADQYGNHASFILNSSKEKKDEELAANAGKKHYIGNGKIMSTGGSGEAVKAGEASKETDLGDLPF